MQVCVVNLPNPRCPTTLVDYNITAAPRKSPDGFDEVCFVSVAHQNANAPTWRQLLKHLVQVLQHMLSAVGPRIARREREPLEPASAKLCFQSLQVSQNTTPTIEHNFQKGNLASIRFVTDTQSVPCPSVSRLSNVLPAWNI